jgi:hypothetical protein
VSIIVFLWIHTLLRSAPLSERTEDPLTYLLIIDTKQRIIVRNWARNYLLLVSSSTGIPRSQEILNLVDDRQKDPKKLFRRNE